MTVASLVEFAGEHRPDLMDKVAEAMDVIGKLCPEFMEDVVEDFQTIDATVLEKVATVPVPIVQGARDYKGWAIGLGLAGAAGLATGVATDLYDAAKRGLTSGRNLKRILKDNPNLQAVDKDTLKRSFNTLHRYSPEFTSDPNLGGQLLSAMVAEPLNNATLVKDLINSRKNLQDIKARQFSPVHIQPMQEAPEVDRAFRRQERELGQDFHRTERIKGEGFREKETLQKRKWEEEDDPKDKEHAMELARFNALARHMSTQAINAEQHPRAQALVQMRNDATKAQGNKQHGRAKELEGIKSKNTQKSNLLTAKLREPQTERMHDLAIHLEEIKAHLRNEQHHVDDNNG